MCRIYTQDDTWGLIRWCHVKHIQDLQGLWDKLLFVIVGLYGLPSDIMSLNT